jgi:bifunctional non-homologous end joining protein LigD
MVLFHKWARIGIKSSCGASCKVLAQVAKAFIPPLPAVCSAMLDAQMFPLQPMPLRTRPLPFDDPNWVFELKYDGFRAMAVNEHDHCQLISRNRNPFASFADLAKNIAISVSNTQLTVLDGEIVCVDRKGKPQFKDLLFRRGDPCFFAFDLLVCDGKDCRMERLTDRKQEL